MQLHPTLPETRFLRLPQIVGNPATETAPANPLASHVTAPLCVGDLVDEHEAAAILSTAVRTLRNWRALRKGPRYRKIGQRMVRYHRDDLAAFQNVMAGDADKADAA